jgi:hypothetical protein
MKNKSKKINKHSYIVTRKLGNMVTTIIDRRDNGIDAVVTTYGNKKGTNLYVALNDDKNTEIFFDGREARTLYGLLQKHYRNTTKLRK